VRGDRRDDVAGRDRSGVRPHADASAVADVDPGDGDALVDRHPPSLRRGRVPPHDSVVPRDRARRVVGRPDDGQLATPGEVDERAHLQGLLGGEDVGLDAERPVEQ
jgi:hypothetical protein